MTAIHRGPSPTSLRNGSPRCYCARRYPKGRHKLVTLCWHCCWSCDQADTPNTGTTVAAQCTMDRSLTEFLTKCGVNESGKQTRIHTRAHGYSYNDICETGKEQATKSRHAVQHRICSWVSLWGRDPTGATSTGGRGSAEWPLCALVSPRANTGHWQCQPQRTEVRAGEQDSCGAEQGAGRLTGKHGETQPFSSEP